MLSLRSLSCVSAKNTPIYIAPDLNYAEIADKMHLSESTVDSHRAKLFEV